MRRIHYKTIDSTSVRARALALEHPGKRLIVTADCQSAGRGRRGRVWQSPAGGAWMTIVWPCANQEPSVPISLVTAVAVRRALLEVAGEGGADLRIKWPNDLLVGDRKVAGILCEKCAGSAADRGGVLAIGIGVNVCFDLSLLPGELRDTATTLSAALGRPIEVEPVVAAVARHVTAALEALEGDGGSMALLDELRFALAYVGTERSWSGPGGVVRGRVLGIDDAGRLLLETASGTTACEIGELVG